VHAYAREAGSMSTQLAQDAAFRQHCNRYLEPLRLGLQQSRRRSWREVFLRLTLSVPLLAAVAVVPLLRKGPEDDFWWWAYGFILLVSACVLMIWVVLPWWTHKDEMKAEVLPRLLPFFGYAYDPEPKTDLEQYVPWAVLPRYNQSAVGDEIRGCHAGIPLRLLELRLRYRETRPNRSSGIATRSRDAVGALVFGGILLELRLAQAVAGTTLIGTPGMFRGHASVLDSSGLEELPLGKVALKAWTDDVDAANAILNATRLRDIEALATGTGLGGLRMSWHRDRIIALLDFGEDFFELPQRRRIDFDADGEQVRTQLSRITAVIDALTLDPVEGAAASTPIAPHPARPQTVHALDEQRGCLWMLLFSVGGFCLYTWLLAGHVRPLGVLALSSTAGALAGVFLSKLLFNRGRMGSLLLFVLCLLGLAPVLPPETLAFWR
jgi:hypothetical protein